MKDKVEALISQTRKECAGTPRAEAVEKALHYFLTNVSRMQYGTFRDAGYFIGSGVVEAGCKTVIGIRCGLAAARMAKESPTHTLPPTALVHEAWL